MLWKWLLSASVALNVALAAAWLWKDKTTGPPAAVAASGPSAGVSFHSPLERGRSSPVQRGERLSRAPRLASPASAEPVETEDYPDFIRRLRELGFSEDTIATLIVAELWDRSLDESVALQVRWNRGEITAEEYQRLSRQLQAEREATAEALLGTETYRRHQIAHDHQIRLLVRSGRYEPAALEKYFDLRKANEQKLRELLDKAPGTGGQTPELTDQRLALQQEFEDQLIAALGADTAQRILAETDWNAQNLRRQLQGAGVADAEFVQLSVIGRQIQREQERLRALQRRGEMSWEEISPRLQSLEEEKKQRIAALLGPTRYAEYEKQTDGTFQQLKQWGQPQGLEARQIDDLYAVLKHWRAEQQELHRQRQSRQLRREDLAAAHEQLNAATREALIRSLGAARYEQLKRAVGWLP